MNKNTRSICQFYDITGKPCRPTLKPYPNFDVNEDIDVLCKSMRCWGTDEEAIINVLGRRPSEQRMEIVSAYKAKYGRELVSDLRRDLSGHFKDCCVLLTQCPYYLMAKSLFYAFKGVGTNENVIIEILVGCYNEELKKLKQAYTYVLRDEGIKDPKRSLESDLRCETKGYFSKMVLQMLNSNESDPSEDKIRRGYEAIVNENEISDVVKQIRVALEKKKNAPELLFNAFANKNSWEIAAIENEYKRDMGKSLVKAIPEVVDGEFGTLLIAMVEHAVNRPRFYSEALYNSMVGAGTHDYLLMRVLILRAEIDLLDIKETFDKDHKSLVDWIKGDTSGHYEKLLLTLLNQS
nr:annexin [Hymenolepis microstoma]